MPKPSKQNLTLGKVAKSIGVPVTTLQGWRGRFGEFMPSYKAPGRRWAVYDEQALGVARLVKKMSADDATTEEIKLALSKQFTPIYDGESENGGEPTTSKPRQQQRDNNGLTTTNQQRGMTVAGEGIFEAFEFNKSLMTQVRHQRELLKIKDQTVGDLQQRVGELERELESANNDLNNERANHEHTRKQLEKAERRPYIRIGGKK